MLLAVNKIQQNSINNHDCLNQFFNKDGSEFIFILKVCHFQYFYTLHTVNMDFRLTIYM